jgi:hypothetical protein
MRGLNNIPGLLQRENAGNEKPGNFVINDIQLHVPPTSISVHKEGLHYSMKSLRTSVTTKILSGSGIYHAQAKITFPQDSIVLLHRLICEIKNSPFVSIKNKFISDSIGKDLPESENIEANHLSFTVMGLQVQNHPSSPNAFLCELDLRYFNHKPYTRFFGFKKDYLNKIGEEYFTHKVFDYSFEKAKRIKINYKDKKSSKKTTVREIAQKYINQNKLNNTQSTLLVQDARRSNAYKRYANYLQSKMLFDNFGIRIEIEGTSDSEANTIYISRELYEAFEGGYTSGGSYPEVFGLHEFVNKTKKLHKQSIEFRKNLITAMILSSGTVTLSYKEFRKYVGDPDFMRRYNNTLELGIEPGTNQTQEEKISIKNKNREEIDERFTKLILETGPEKVAAPKEKEGGDLGVEDFYQIDYSERFPNNSYDNIILEAQANKTNTNELYYPPLLNAVYKEENYTKGKKNVYKIRSIGNKGETTYLFCPIISAQVYSYDNKIIVHNSIYHITFEFEDENSFASLLDLKLNIYTANTGDIIGYVFCNTDITVVSNLNLVETFKKPKKGNQSNAKRNQSNIVYGELTTNDVEEFKKYRNELDKSGYAVNNTRSSSHQVLEKVSEISLGVVLRKEAIGIITGENTNGRLTPSQPTVITNVSGSIRHVMASIPIIGLQSPTHQFLGSIEPNYQISFIGKDSGSGSGEMPDALKKLESIRNLMSYNAKNFAFIPDSGNIFVSSFITKLLGSEKVRENVFAAEEGVEEYYPNIVMSSTDTFTVEGSPGVTGMHVRFAESKSYTEEKLAPARSSSVNENIYKEILDNYKFNPKTSTAESQTEREVFTTLPLNGKSEYSDLKEWKTKDFNSVAWYRKATYTGGIESRKWDKNNEKHKQLDKNAFLFCKEYLQPLQDFLNAYGKITNETFKIKLKSTFDYFGKTHRETKSNHFANVAADIYVPGMNVMELVAIIHKLVAIDYIKGKDLRKDQYTPNSTLNCGMGLYGKQAHEYTVKMGNKGQKKNGFVHLDANFAIITSNRNLSYSPQRGGRRWVGESKEDAFRCEEHNEYNDIPAGEDVYYFKKNNGIKDAETKSLIRQSSQKFWGWGNIAFDDSKLKAVIGSINTKITKALEALKEQVTNSNQVEEIEIDEDETNLDASETHYETTSGKQSSVRSRDLVYTKEGLADLFEIEESDLTTLLVNEIEDKDILNNNFNKKLKNNYSYIRLPSFKDPDSTFGLGPMGILNQLEKVKKTLEGTGYILIQENKKELNNRYTKSGFDGFILALPKNTYEQRKILSKNKKETEKMLDAFQLLASIVLTEPHLYMDSKEEAIAELERINKKFGLDVIPCLYNSVESGVLGVSSLGLSLIKLNIEKKLILNKTLFDLGGILSSSGLISAAIAISNNISASLSGGAVVEGFLGVIGTGILAEILAPILLIVGISGSISSAIGLFEDSEKNFLLQKKRILLFLDKIIDLKNYDEEYIKTYLNNIANLIKIYTKGGLKTSIGEEDINSIKELLGDSLTINEGINRYFKLLFSKNAAFKYFEKIAEDLSADSQLNNLLNYKANELLEDESPEKFIGNSLILGGGILKEYLMFLYEIPRDVDVGLFIDMLNEDEGEASDIFDVDENDTSNPVTLEVDEDELRYSDETKWGTKRNLLENQVIDYKNTNGKLFFTKERKARLKRNQADKISWLEGILKVLLETNLFLDENPEVQELRHRLERSGNIFDSDTYPDIVVPENPRTEIANKKLEPSFYYWDTKELNKTRKEKLFKRTEENSKKILKNSLEFEKAISDGIYTGPTRQLVKDKNGNKVINTENFKSTKDISLYALDSYIFKDSFDSGVESNVGGEKLKTILEQQITAPATQIDALKDSLKSIIDEMGFQGEVVDSSKTLMNKLGTENFEELNPDESLKLSDEAFEHFYENDDMLKAYPTFKLYLVEEDEEISDKLLVFDDFYYYNSVIGFSFNNSRELPAQTATIQLQNISGTLDGSKKVVLRDIDIVRDSRKTPYASDDNLIVDSIVLRPGINVQLRAGYGSHSKDLSVLLNGRVTEVNYSSDNMVASITVQSFGIELDSNFKNTYAEGNNFKFNSTAEVLASLSYSEELKHFGRIKKGKVFPFGESSGQKVLDIENLNEDVSYTYSLFEGGLGFFERNAKAIAIGLIALEFIGPIGKITSFVFPGVNKVLSNTGKAIAKSTKDIYNNSKILQALGFPLKGAKWAYDKTNKLVGRNFYKDLDRNNVKLLLTLNRTSNTNARINLINNAITAGKLTRYEANRLLGKGVLSSFFSRGAIKVTDEIVEASLFKAIYQRYGYAKALAYLEKSSGAATSKNLFGSYTSLLFGSKQGGKLISPELFFNQFNIIPKISAITTGAFIAALYGGALGLVGDIISYPFSENPEYAFQRRKNRLRKRVILSPIDDNLFPPLLDSYAIEGEEEGFFGPLWSYFNNAVVKNLQIGLNFTTYSLLNSGGEPPSIETLIKNKIKLSTKFLKKGNETQFLISNQSTWDVLKELTYRHPGYVYGIRPYGENFEYRMFFGKPNQRYYSDSLTNSEAFRLQNLRIAIDDIGSDNKLKESYCSNLYKDIWERFKGGDEEEAKEELAKVAIEEFVNKTKKRFTPFRKYHSINSHRNLIANNIITSGHNVINTVQVHTYMEDDEYDGKSESDDVYTVTLKASQNIPRELEQTKTLQNRNIRGIGNANRYGIAELIYSSKEMYTGSLLVLGNPNINPWDVVVLNDRVNNMSGPLEVKAVTHSFSHETGFLTDIEVNAMVTANDFMSMPMLQQVVVHEARKRILEEYNSRGELGLSNNPEKDKEILKEQVLEAIEKMSEEERSIIDSSWKATHIFNNPGTQATSGILSSIFGNSGDINEEFLNSVVDKLYESYRNPESLNFTSEIVNENSSGLFPEIEDATSTVEAAAGTTALGVGGVVALKQQVIDPIITGATRSGKGGVIAAGVGVLLLIDSYTVNVLGKGINKMSRYFYDDYLEENIAKPFILSKTTDESVIRIMPLIKDGKPLLSGGYEKVSEQEKWKSVYGNFYNNMSDGYRGYLKEKKRIHAEGARILNNLGEYSWAKAAQISVVGWLDGEEKNMTAFLYGEGEE